MKNDKKVAIFDIDGTIFRSSLLIELVDALISKGHFPAKAAKEYEKSLRAWQDRSGTYEEYISDVVEAFRKNLKGVPYGKLKDISEGVIKEKSRRTYTYTRDLIKDLRKKNYFLLAISQSPKAVLDPFCKKLGFNKAYGRIYELDSLNNFTGEVVDEHLIENKANIVRRALEKEGLALSSSVGVGDTEGDISFLELVENPICFNPNKKLYKYAKLNSWKVVVERKDVIYELN